NLCNSKSFIPNFLPLLQISPSYSNIRAIIFPSLFPRQQLFILEKFFFHPSHNLVDGLSLHIQGISPPHSTPFPLQSLQLQIFLPRFLALVSNSPSYLTFFPSLFPRQQLFILEMFLSLSQSCRFPLQSLQLQIFLARFLALVCGSCCVLEYPCPSATSLGPARRNRREIRRPHRLDHGGRGG
ncbi:hypothetical protein EGW08_022338, partial [Elysia chlorotica]